MIFIRIGHSEGQLVNMTEEVDKSSSGRENGGYVVTESGARVDEVSDLIRESRTKIQ